MSLIDGLILHTIAQGETQSQHSLLMRFYELEKLIDAAYSESYKKAFHSFPVYFMEIEARTILRVLNII